MFYCYHTNNVLQCSQMYPYAQREIAQLSPDSFVSPRVCVHACYIKCSSAGSVFIVSYFVQCLQFCISTWLQVVHNSVICGCYV